MKNTILKQAFAVAVLALSATAANAQTKTYDFNYIAQAQTSSALSAGANIANLGGTKVGSITFTDLADLNLGDGKTGVRISVALNNLSQFYSGTGSIWSNSVEFSFPGTGAYTGGVEFVTSADSLRKASSNYDFTTGGDGGIEWDEHGSVGNGTANTSTSHKWAFFQQQNNFVTGTFTEGETIVWDYLNGGTQIAPSPDAGSAYNGFNVASLISVANQDGAQPNAWSWLRVRSTDGGIASTGWYSNYLLSSTNVATGVTTQTLQFLAVEAVPESDTYAMLLAGLGIIGMVVKRRQKLVA
jgi:hypothetical protein